MKRFYLTFILLFLLAADCFSQDSLQVAKYNYFHNYEEKDCSKSIEYAKEDINKGSILLYTSAGMTPIDKKIGKKLNKFQKKYGIEFPNFGCVAPNYKCVLKYNNYVFDHLILKHGENWRKKVNKKVILYMNRYVIGFSDWKKERKQ